MKFPVRMGLIPDKAYVNVSAAVWVVPDETINLNLDPWVRQMRPGVFVKDYNYGLNPVDINVKAGTSGRIELVFKVEYQVFARYASGKYPVPIPFTGTLVCKYDWNYDCSDDGDISITNPLKPSEDSGVQDDVQVIIHSAAFQASPHSGLPFVKARTRVVYTGRVNPGPTDLPWIVANLQPVDFAVIPDMTPNPELLSRTFYFEHEEGAKFDAKAVHDWVILLKGSAPFLASANNQPRP
jgi:hypothetical protein